MRLKLRELKEIVKKAIKEAFDTPTLSSDLDPKEKELADRFPKWADPSLKKLKHDSPAVTKAKKVAAVLQSRGITSDASKKKKVTHELVPWLEKMDPGDMFIADPEELADEFDKTVLSQQH